MEPSVPLYKASVAKLLELAMEKSPDGRAAAQVLLSTYNGHHYHIQATDLCCLDGEWLEAAIIVLAQRSLTHREPHGLDPSFDDQFSDLVAEWGHLHVRQRYCELY